MPSRHVKCQLSLKFRSDSIIGAGMREKILKRTFRKKFCNISHENQYEIILVANAKSRLFSKYNSIIDLLGHFWFKFDQTRIPEARRS